MLSGVKKFCGRLRSGALSLVSLDNIENILVLVVVVTRWLLWFVTYIVLLSMDDLHCNRLTCRRVLSDKVRLKLSLFM